MKISCLFLPAVLLLSPAAFAQTAANFTLSKAYPEASENLSFTYSPAGTPLDGKKGINAVIYYVNNKIYKVDDITLNTSGKLISGSFTVDTGAKAFFIKFYSGGNAVDNSQKEGYVYLVSKNEKPVPGAYASKGFILATRSAAYLTKLKPLSADDALALYKKELELYPGSIKTITENYYFQLGRSKDAANHVLAGAKIIDLEKSGREADLGTAYVLLDDSKQKEKADSLLTVIKTKYPDGSYAKEDKNKELFKNYEQFIDEKALQKRDSLYIVIHKMPKDTTYKFVYEYMDALLAAAYQANGDMPKYKQYESGVTDKSTMALALNSVAYDDAEKGEHLAAIEKMSAQSLELIQPLLNTGTANTYFSANQEKAQHQQSYDYYLDTYAYIFYQEKKYATAIKYEAEVYNRNPTLDTAVNEHYTVMLKAAGKYAQSKEVAEASIKEGLGTKLIKETLKMDYVKLKGSDAGYEEYLGTLQNTAMIKKD